jgi:hypothetical protein
MIKEDKGATISPFLSVNFLTSLLILKEEVKGETFGPENEKSRRVS